MQGGAARTVMAEESLAVIYGLRGGQGASKYFFTQSANPLNEYEEPVHEDHPPGRG